MRTLIQLLLAGWCALCAALPAHAQDKTIKMGAIGVFEDTLLIALISQRLLEEQGFKVELTRFAEQGILYAALSKGDVDIVDTNINYVTHELWSKYKNRLEKISVVSHGLYQTLVVPSYMPIDSIEQLNDIAGQVDGKIIGIETGSGIYRDTEKAIKAYNLNYQQVAGSTPGMIAQLKSALERKAPIVTMLWDPSWMMHEFDVKFLKDPKGIYAPVQSHYWIGKKGFSANNPKAREVLASIYIPVEDIRSMGAQVNQGASHEQAVDTWWQEHQDLIKRWKVMSVQ